MNRVEIMSCLLQELGKLLLRSDDKAGTVLEGALKFVNTHAYTFGAEAELLVKRLQTPNHFDHFFQYLFGDDQEPCHLPFTPGNWKTEVNAGGFPVHIYKGEQDIAPLVEETVTITSKHYYRHVHSLRHDLKRLETPPSFETWIYLLQRYAKWLPACTSLSHISLYDYARLKIALAACLPAERMAAWYEARQAGQPYGDKVAALVALKIVGQEAFLAALAKQPSLRLSKGTHYYFQMVREAMTKQLIETLQLLLCNCLWQAGDTVVLLVGHGDLEKIAAWRLQLETWLVQHYQGMISLAAYELPLTIADLKDKDFSLVFPHLWHELAKNCHQPFVQLLGHQSNWQTNIFGPFDDPHDSGSLATSLERLSDSLTDARWVSIKSAATSPTTNRPPQQWEDTLQMFHQTVDFYSHKPDDTTGCQIYRFGNTDFACRHGVGFKFSELLAYLGHEPAAQPTWHSHWVIVQVKIDRPSGPHQHSLCSYLSQHEHLQDFFKTYLSSLLREKKYRDLTYLLHTEYHHLTMVCSPHIALVLLQQIHQKFWEFTGDRGALSGKVSLLPVEYPIQQALFQERKKFDLQKDGSHRLVIGGEPMQWSWLDSLLAAEEKLNTIAKLKGKRFLFPLWGVAELYRLRHRGSRDKKQHLLWRHVIAYHLTRLGITDYTDGDKGPGYLALAIFWNYLMAQDSQTFTKTRND